MAKEQSRKSNKHYERKIITAPKYMFEHVINDQLQEWGLAKAKDFKVPTKKDRVHGINFYDMIDLYSVDKKHFLLKLLLNDCGLDINATEDEGEVFNLVVIEGLEERATKAVRFLSERGPVNSPENSVEVVATESTLEDSEDEQETSEKSDESIHATEEVEQESTVDSDNVSK